MLTYVSAGSTRKKVLIVCGTGIATSTVIADKVRSHLEAQGIPASIDQTKVSEVLSGAPGYDLVVATTQVPRTIEAPIVNGLPFLTGMGVEEALSEITEKLKG
jgi:PTS system galactitol-specific IIB component